MSELELRLAWERFVELSNTPESREAFDSVLSRHAEPQRHYHTLDHVAWVLRHIDSFEHPDIDRQLAGAAAIFHDSIYDPTRDDNELESARLADDTLLRLGWAPDRAGRVAEIIRATADHPIVGDVTTSAVCCADLAILAAEPTEYGDYVNQVRQEYGFVDEASWRSGRAAVLDSFLARPAIFDLRIAPDDWEVRARGNIAAELAELST